MKDLKDYPIELVENRNIIEGNFIFCLWSEPELYGDYCNDIRTNKDILTDSGQFYYSLGFEMYKAGYKNFDEISILTYISDKEDIRVGFENRDGMKSINEIRKIINVENVDAYHDELLKSNIILSLYDKNFSVINDLGKLKKMTSYQIYSYYEYHLDNIFLNKGNGVKIEDLDISNDFIESCDSGYEMGLSYSSSAPILNYHTLGIHKSNIQIFAGFSGTGKTSFCVNTYIMSILDQGKSITIIANEMNKRAWQHIFMATILSQKLDYYGLPRKKQKMGNLSKEQKQMMYQAQKYHNKHYKGRIKFAKIYDYSTEDVKRIIRKMSKKGHEYFLYDTFKAEDASSNTVTGELIEASKQLLQVAEKEDVAIIITMQLAIYMENTRYLTSSCLSNAKGVKEVVSELILTRSIWEDEYNDEKYDIKPYRLKRDENGKYTNIKEFIILDKDKEYKILFIDKTRNDGGDVCILFQFDGAWNKWTEIGFCTVKHVR